MGLPSFSKALSAPLAGISAATFSILTALRGERIFHPDGLALKGTLAFHEGNDLPFEGTHEVAARLSRGAGLPGAWPDVLGLAIKLPEGQDFLLATSGTGAISRHLLLPAAGFFKRPYSSVLPYDYKGQLIVLGARADAALTSVSQQDLGDLPARVATGSIRFDLFWGHAGTDETIPFATLVLDGRHEGDLSFNPWRTHASLRPAGSLNRSRREAYEGSRRTRGGPSATEG